MSGGIWSFEMVYTRLFFGGGEVCCSSSSSSPSLLLRQVPAISARVSFSTTDKGSLQSLALVVPSSISDSELEVL